MKTFAKLLYLFLITGAGFSFIILPPGIWKNAALGAAIGGLLGYATNWLVIWMLFHPRKALTFPTWMGGFPVPFTPGLMVKKQEYMAASVGKTVSSKFLSPETIRDELQAPETRDAISTSLHAEVHALAQKRYPPLSQLLDRESLVNCLKAKNKLLENVAGILREYMQSPACKKQILDFFYSELKKQATVPLNNWIPISERQAITEWATSQLSEYLQGEDAMRSFRSLCRRIDCDRSGGEITTKDKLVWLAREFLEPQVPRLIEEAMKSLQEKCGEPETDSKIRDRLTSELEGLIERTFADKLRPLAMPGLVQDITRPLVRKHVNKHWDAVKEEFFSSRDVREFATEELKASAERLLLFLKDRQMAADPRVMLFQRELFDILGQAIQRNVDEQLIEDTLFQKIEGVFRQTLEDLFPNWEEAWENHSKVFLETFISGTVKKKFIRPEYDSG